MGTGEMNICLTTIGERKVKRRTDRRRILAKILEIL
jgi:hypothetical protein